MKKSLFALGFALLSWGSVNAQMAPKDATQPATSLAEISFNKDVHDYGNIKQGANGHSEFTFTNTGKEPLIIYKAVGSCGCTVPEFPTQPIKPGEKATIKVKYDTNRPGPINKSVTVTSNAQNGNGTTILRITGNVEAAPTNTTPVQTPSVGAPVEKK